MDFDQHLAEAGISGRRAAIYDTNTVQAEGLIRPTADLEIILAADGLSADDGAVADVMRQLGGDAAVLIAVGSCTIHDITRYCAQRLGIPFVSCPTAASVDGYTSNVCVMQWQGAQVILPGVAPTLVLADLNVIRQAPAHLARAGVGEAIAKFTALADWSIAGALTDQPGCPVVESLLRQAAIAAQGCSAEISSGHTGSYAQLMYALLLSGLAIQMADDVSPAYGAEHMLSALMDAMPDTFGGGADVSHGEQVGVCATVIADLYHRLAEIDDITPYVKAFAPLEVDTLAKDFGKPEAERLVTLNTPDCLLAVDSDRLTARWETVRRIIAELPDKAALQAMLASAQAKQSMEDLGVHNAKLPRMLQLSPSLRNQLTLARLLRMIKFRYASSADASRAPSRRSRYADSAITRAGKSNAMPASSMR